MATELSCSSPSQNHFTLHFPMVDPDCYGHSFASNRIIQNDNLESGVCVRTLLGLYREVYGAHIHRTIKLTEIANSACHPLKWEQPIYVSRSLVWRKILILFPSFILSCIFLLCCGESGSGSFAF